MKAFPSVFVLLVAFWSCANMDYDVSRGVDKEVTLASDQFSLPVADSIGPFTPKLLFADGVVGDAIKDFIHEDEDGYIVSEKQERIYSNVVFYLYYFLPDPSQPADVPLDNCSISLSSCTETLTELGFSLSPQLFSLYAGNPLTEGITLSGKLSMSSKGDSENPAKTLLSQEFSGVKVEAGESDGSILQIEDNGKDAFHAGLLENLVMHTPASMLEKDPSSGMGGFTLQYRYKTYLSLESDFINGLPIDVNLSLPLAQYSVSEAQIRADVSNEIPLTLEISSVEVLVEKTDEDGNTSNVVSDDVDVVSSLTAASGISGAPVISPLEVNIKAREGAVIPDISALRLTFSIKAPTGSGDRRLNVEQAMYLNNIRATVYGGITLGSL